MAKFEDIDLPNVKGILDPDKKIYQGKSEEENLVNQSRKFQKIWKGSPFYLEQTVGANIFVSNQSTPRGKEDYPLN
ncbi:hypothetical protein ACE6H2_005029 [Prunus campanulata]